MLFRRPIRLVFFLILTSLGTFVQNLQGEEKYSHREPPFSVELVSSHTAFGNGTEMLMGVHFKLPPPWKISAPVLDQKKALNLSGLSITWEQSENVKRIKILWPLGKAFSQEGFHFQAYEGDFMIPFRIETIDPLLPVKVKLNLVYSLCASGCIPFHHSLTFDFLPGAAIRTLVAPLLENQQVLPIRTSFKDSEESEVKSYSLMLIFAFLGGLILNFMPCVLPVLSLKMISIAKKGYSSSQTIHYRAGFLATFAGIIVSFMLLASMAISLDAFGLSVGWGLHFQEPLFLYFLVIMTTFFAANLWGFFPLHLPIFIQEGINKIFNLKKGHRSEYGEDFITGMFATLLATPCTAPFLGTALGYAFTRTPSEIFLFFIIMGLGFSFPYWLGACLPLHWLKVPKPGPWMEKLSFGLGFILVATSLWLLWILAAVTSSLTSLTLGCGTVALFFVLWLGQRNDSLKKLRGPIGALIIGISVYMIQGSETNEPYTHSFSPDHIPSWIQKGNVVVVDVTAAWCLTCKMNHLWVLDTQKGKEILSAPDIVYMEADWTKRNASIADYLTSFGRAGIPFNIVFGPKAPQGIILPEILKLKDLQDAINQARGIKTNP